MRLKNHWLEAVIFCFAVALVGRWWYLSAHVKSFHHPVATPPVNRPLVNPPVQSALANGSLGHSSIVSSSVANPSSASQPTTTATKTAIPRRSQPAVALKYRIESYHSIAMPGERTYGVILPPGYQQHPHQRYPVIFLLHGGHGTPMDWLQPQKGNVPVTLHTLYQMGQLTPSIVITPDGNDQRGSNAQWDPDYFDGPHGNLGTAIGDELVKVIQSRYRTLPAPAAWAIGGLSSGAWGSLNIGLHYPHHFGTLFSHSGYFVDKSGPQNSPMELVTRLSPRDRQRISIYIDSGTTDQHYLTQAQEFYRRLQQQGINSELIVFPGAHSWRYWREHLRDSLSFVEKQFQAAAVSPNHQVADRQ